MGPSVRQFSLDMIALVLNYPGINKVTRQFALDIIASVLNYLGTNSPPICTWHGCFGLGVP